MVKFLDLNKQYLSIKSEIDDAIASVIESSAFVGGKFGKQFEQDFASYIGAEYCVGVGNGTDALELAIEALDLPPKSEIIVPGNSFIATSEAVTRSGHSVVFADVEEDTYNLSTETIKAKHTGKTAAVIVVHLYGHPCEMVSIMELASELGLRVIEDCAQAVGAKCHGRSIGTFGDVATFSFYPGKNLGAYGDAGSLVTNDEALAARARKIANHGRVDKYDHDIEGRNSRLDGIQAAILSTKLRHLETWTERRIHVAKSYRRALKGVEGIVVPQCCDWARHVYHLFVIRVAEPKSLAAQLKEKGIASGIHYPTALPKLLAYKYLGQAEDDMFVNRSDVELLSLPMGDHLEDREVQQVVEAVMEYFR